MYDIFALTYQNICYISEKDVFLKMVFNITKLSKNIDHIIKLCQEISKYLSTFVTLIMFSAFLHS